MVWIIAKIYYLLKIRKPLNIQMEEYIKQYNEQKSQEENNEKKDQEENINQEKSQDESNENQQNNDKLLYQNKNIDQQLMETNTMDILSDNNWLNEKYLWSMSTIIIFFLHIIKYIILIKNFFLKVKKYRDKFIMIDSKLGLPGHSFKDENMNVVDLSKNCLKLNLKIDASYYYRLFCSFDDQSIVLSWVKLSGNHTDGTDSPLVQQDISLTDDACMKQIMKNSFNELKKEIKTKDIQSKHYGIQDIEKKFKSIDNLINILHKSQPDIDTKWNSIEYRYEYSYPMLEIIEDIIDIFIMAKK